MSRFSKARSSFPLNVLLPEEGQLKQKAILAGMIWPLYGQLKDLFV